MRLMPCHDCLQPSAPEDRACSGGLNDDGQLGNGSTKDADEPQVCQLGTATAIQVACGGMHSLVLVKGGSVYGCGKNWSGQLGLDAAARIDALAARTT